VVKKDKLINFDIGDKCKEFTIDELRYNKTKKQFETIYGGGSIIVIKVTKDDKIPDIIEKFKTDFKKELAITEGQEEDDKKLIDELIDEDIAPQIQNKIEDIFSDDDTEEEEIKSVTVFKYSQGIPLAEEIEIDNDRKFLQIIDDKPVLSTEIDLSKITGVKLKLKPNALVGGTPILPYTFKNEEEIKYYINVAKNENIDSLYKKACTLWRSLIVTRKPHYLKFLAFDSVYGYFMDMFPTTHYVSIIGRPGTGKGAILVSMVLLGYRVLRTILKHKPMPMKKKVSFSPVQALNLYHLYQLQ